MAKTKSSTKLSAPRKAAKIEKGRGLAEASVPPRGVLMLRQQPTARPEPGRRSF